MIVGRMVLSTWFTPPSLKKASPSPMQNSTQVLHAFHSCTRRIYWAMVVEIGGGVNSIIRHHEASLIIILVRLFVCLFVQTITRAFVRLGASDSTRALLGVAGRSSSLSLAVCGRPAKIRSLLRRHAFTLTSIYIKERLGNTECNQTKTI